MELPFIATIRKPEVLLGGKPKIGKIPSALITNLELCKLAREYFETLIISTGMSTEKEIEECIKICKLVSSL